MNTSTTITVYALAWGGKFIGTGQDGLALLTVTDAAGNVVAGQSRKPINEGGTGDGSGVTSDIMNTYFWGTPVNHTEAFSYTFSFSPGKPMQLTFTVEVYHNDQLMATASNQQVVWPGLTLAGATSVVVWVPGLLTNVVATQTPLQFYSGEPNLISVNVYMMCGCKIDNDYWPGNNFDVQAVVSDSSGALIQSIPLKWASLATFTGNWTPTGTGNVTLQSFVVETTNGNTACSATVPAVVTVKG